MLKWMFLCLGQTLTLTVALSLSFRASHPDLRPETAIGAAALVASVLSVLFALALLEFDSIKLAVLSPPGSFLLGLTAQCVVWAVWTLWRLSAEYLLPSSKWWFAIAVPLCVASFCGSVAAGTRLKRRRKS